MNNLYRKKKYTQGHLRELIKNKRGTGKTCREIKQELNIGSTRTISKWCNSETLESKSSAPINPSRKFTLVQIYKLYALRKYRELSIDDCKYILEEENQIIMSRSLIGGYLKQWEFTKRKKRETKKFKEYDPGYLHVDISYGPKFNGQKYYIYVAIDRATRTMYLEVHKDKKAETAADFLKNVVDFFPFEIEKILTDNGKEFTLKNHLGKVDLEGAFDKICKEFEIEHRLTKTRHPRTNGMVEKVNDTIKSNTVGKYEYESSSQMIQDMLGFMIYYNISKRHGGIIREKKGKTPYDALNYYYNIMPEIFKQTPNKFRKKLMKYKKQSLFKNIKSNM